MLWRTMQVPARGEAEAGEAGAVPSARLGPLPVRATLRSWLVPLWEGPMPAPSTGLVASKRHLRQAGGRKPMRPSSLLYGPCARQPRVSTRSPGRAWAGFAHGCSRVGHRGQAAHGTAPTNTPAHGPRWQTIQPAPPAEPHTRAQAMPVPKPRVLCPQEMATVLCAREGGAHVHHWATRPGGQEAHTAASQRPSSTRRCSGSPREWTQRQT